LNINKNVVHIQRYFIPVNMENQMIPSKIVGIQFSLFSPEEIEKYSVVEVTNKETYVGIKPKIGGLFDPRMGVLEPGMICPTDGMNYINCPGYFGHVKLAKPVFWVQHLDEIIDILKCVCHKCGKLLISKKENISLMDYPNEKRWSHVLEICKGVKRCGDESENGCGCLQPEKVKQEGFANIIAEWQYNSADDEGKVSKESMVLKITPEMVLKLFKKISDEDVNFMGWSSIWSRPEWMVCTVFPVAPPAMRPSVKHDAQQRSEDDLTHIMINIIKHNNKLKQLIENKDGQNTELNNRVIDDWTSVLQYYVATMVDNKISGASPVTQRSGRALKSISERHKGKTGRVRGNLMGKRVDFSARSVITPDPELSIAELGVPMKIAKNITKPVEVQKHNINFLYYLVKNGPNEYPGAKILEKKNGVSISLGYVDRNNIKLEIGDIVHRHMLNGDYVLFNRQPTLHRMSMMAHIVRVMKHGDTFRMNVAVTRPYNADFDGDEMNMHMPQNDEAESELRYLANIPNHIVSPGNNKPIIGIFQDSMIGSFLYTRPNEKMTRKQAMNLLMKTNVFNTTDIFKNTNKQEFTNFEVLSEIIPSISLKYKTDLFKEKDEYEDSNNVLEIQDGTIHRGQFDKGVLGGSSKGLLHRIKKDYDAMACKDFVDNLQGIITEYMKTTGFSVGISDLIADSATNEKIEGIIQEKKKEVANLIDQVHLGIFENKTGKSNEEHFETQVNNILNKASNDAGNAGVNYLNLIPDEDDEKLGGLDPEVLALRNKLLRKENRFVSIVTSGSKGNNLNISQMISCLGQQNVDGKRIPYGYTNRTLPHFQQFDDTPKARGFVENSFIGGLTPDELFFHAMGGRVGLIDTAVKTSSTGYIQRRLIKGMEDIQVMYDNTVRNNKNKIIQFNYGGTNFDTTHIEKVSFNLLEMNLDEIYEYFSYDFEDRSYLKLIYEKSALTKFRKSENVEKLKEKSKGIIHNMVIARNDLVENVYDQMVHKEGVYLPVHFINVIESIKQQFKITSHHLCDITPLEAYEFIDHTYSRLQRMFSPCKMFETSYYYYMNPVVLLHKHKFNKRALEFLCEKVIHLYKKGVINPGEMVGMVSAQSIGEPTTQMSLKWCEKIHIIQHNKKTGVNDSKIVKIGPFCDAIAEQNPEHTFPTGHENSYETLLETNEYEYYIVGVDKKEQTKWCKISHVSIHPTNGDMMRVKTRSGRTVETTLSHSHLFRCEETQQVESIRGADLKKGMRIPVAKSIESKFENTEIQIGDEVYELDYLFGWFMGAYLAEGNVSGTSINISNISDIYISQTTEIAKRFGKNTRVSRRSGEYGLSISTIFSHKPLAEFLIETCGTGSFVKKVPEFAYSASQEFKSGLFQGYFDGDGNVQCDAQHHQIRACSQSEDLIQGLALLLNYFDIFANITTEITKRKEGNKKMYNLIVSHKYASQYKDMIGTKLHTESLDELIQYNNRIAHAIPDLIDKVPGLGKIIAECGKTLKLPGQSRTYGRWAKKESIGRRTMEKYVETFQAHENAHMIREHLEILNQALNSNVIWDEIVDIEVYTPETEKEQTVYDFTVPDNQTFMMFNGTIVHNTLNTFHYAGVASKSNVTRGVPRIEEILTLTKKLKNPSMTIFLKDDDSADMDRAYKIASRIEHTKIRDIITKSEIYYEPSDSETRITYDEKLMQEYNEFVSLINKCYDDTEIIPTAEEKAEDGQQAGSLDNTNNWIIRMELDETAMLDMNITNEDIHFTMRTLYGHAVSCFYSDYNTDNKIVFRIRINSPAMKKKIDSFTEEDHIYLAKTFQDKILNEMVIRGIKNIEKVNLRQMKHNLKYNTDTGNYDKKEIYVLDTVGTNLTDVLALEYIDTKKTFTNDIIEMYNVLGIEAARKCLFNEILEVMEFDNTYINHHHIHLLCDRMTCNESMVSIFRHGINKDNIGPIAKASFEETSEMFLQAARHGELDEMRGVSANVMCGQEGYYGTSAFQTYVDNSLMFKYQKEMSHKPPSNSKDIDDEENLEGLMNKLLEDDEETNECSIENLKKQNVLNQNMALNIQKHEDDEYELDI
jgi:DNA-directed RNA polymerase beta' subunit